MYVAVNLRPGCAGSLRTKWLKISARAKVKEKPGEEVWSVLGSKVILSPPYRLGPSFRGYHG